MNFDLPSVFSEIISRANQGKQLGVRQFPFGFGEGTTICSFAGLCVERRGSMVNRIFTCAEERNFLGLSWIQRMSCPDLVDGSGKERFRNANTQSLRIAGTNACNFVRRVRIKERRVSVSKQRIFYHLDLKSRSARELLCSE